MNTLIKTFRKKSKSFMIEFGSGDLRRKSELLWKTSKFFLWHLFLIPLSIIIMPGIIVFTLLFDSLIRVRIGKLEDDRIGHLAHNTDIYLRRMKMGKKVWREWHLMVCDKTANRQLLSMIKRRLCVLEHPIFLKFYKAARGWSYPSRIWADMPCDYGAFEEYRIVKPPLSFTEEENARGQNQLLRMGIPVEKSFVCMNARDNRYLKEQWVGGKKNDWQDQDFRNSNIDTFLPGAEYLASQGIYVLRMGHTVADPLMTTNERIIDYATRWRSDFMDVFLTGHGKFFLGDTAGLHCVALAFGVPVAAANWIPIRYTPPGKQDLFIPKKLWDISRKRFLTFKEIIEGVIDRWEHAEQYIRSGIEPVSNTPEEILELVKEMNERIDGVWTPDEEDEELQMRYRALFPPSHYSYGFHARVGADFLRKNQDLLAGKRRDVVSV
ncbi:MAG: TIGR04372 family glycosyltransferase [Candidatus Omnitrophica bacterium]|nr:TIGR04372 family glycosyltransferase [Candidatus Omnitrophota bacterium]